MQRDPGEAIMYHVPVLTREVINYLVIQPGLYIDGTLGGGGHCEAILSALEEKGMLEHSFVLGIDQDPEAIEVAQKRVSRYASFFEAIESNVEHLETLVKARATPLPFVGLLLDLGVSSHQFDEPTRGFSFRFDAPLDMRMSPRTSVTANHILAEWDEKALSDLFFMYGEEPKARALAKRIVEVRRAASLMTTTELAGIVRTLYPPFPKERQTKALARVFQALRIEVNRELEILSAVLNTAEVQISTGGRIAVISYHSLEDRVVKHFFRHCASDEWADVMIPQREPIRRASLRVLTKKPIEPSEDEIRENSRARSAKLRIAERL